MDTAADKVLTAAQVLIADLVETIDEIKVVLDRTKIARWCGYDSPKKAGWIFEYLVSIGFLTIERRYVRGHKGRATDAFTVNTEPPANYIGPRTYAGLDQALATPSSPHTLFDSTRQNRRSTSRGPFGYQDLGLGTQMGTKTPKTAGQDLKPQTGTKTGGLGAQMGTKTTEYAGQGLGTQMGPFYQIDRRSSISEGEIEDRSIEGVPRNEDTAPMGAVVDVPGVQDLVLRLPWKEWAAKRRVSFRWTKGDADAVTAAINQAVAGAGISLAQVQEIAVAALRKADSNPVGYVASAFGDKHLPTWVGRLEEGPPLASDPVPLEPADPGAALAPVDAAHREAPAFAGPVTSPVTWLTDAQFAALSPQDRAHVRAVGDTPIDQLKPLAARRITAITCSVQAAAEETADSASESEPDLAERRIS